MNARVKGLVVAAAVLLALLVGYQSGAERAEADVGPFGGIYAQDGRDVLTVAGEVWQFDQGGWSRQAESDPPVPVFEIASWERGAFVTTGGDCWGTVGLTWVNYGSPPGGVRVEESSFGAIKAKYGDN